MKRGRKKKIDPATVPLRTTLFPFTDEENAAIERCKAETERYFRFKRLPEQEKQRLLSRDPEYAARIREKIALVRDILPRLPETLRINGASFSLRLDSHYACYVGPAFAILHQARAESAAEAARLLLEWLDADAEMTDKDRRLLEKAQWSVDSDFIDNDLVPKAETGAGRRALREEAWNAHKRREISSFDL